jgi:hypothetical protein
MIKKLNERRQAPRVRAFLCGILNKKSFYVYYNRAGDEQLDRIVRAERRELMNITERQNPRGLCGEAGNLIQRS